MERLILHQSNAFGPAQALRIGLQIHCTKNFLLLLPFILSPISVGAVGSSPAYHAFTSGFDDSSASSCAITLIIPSTPTSPLGGDNAPGPPPAMYPGIANGYAHTSGHCFPEFPIQA
nr:hypothetical protein GOBAR_DD20979 [Ipomoea batatas]